MELYHRATETKKLTRLLFRGSLMPGEYGGRRAAANSRHSTWAAAWRLTMNSVFGVGIRNSALLLQAYALRTIPSQYLQAAADSGLVSLVVYLTALCVCWSSTREARLLVRKRHRPKRVPSLRDGLRRGRGDGVWGAMSLSLKNFALPYLMLLLGAQFLLRAPGRANHGR